DLADLDQQVRGGDDAVRRRLRRALPGPPPRASLARVLAVPLSEHDGDLAPVQEPADVGRLRRLDVRDRLAALLVCRPGAGHGHAPRSLAVARGRNRLRDARDGLAGLGAAL